jgi:hypothetical protein
VEAQFGASEGLFDQWSQVHITLLRSRIRIRIKVKSRIRICIKVKSWIRIRVKVTNFLVELWLHLAYSGQYFKFQPWETGYYIRALREQNAIEIFRCPSGKYHSVYSPYALNELTQ